MPKRFYCLIAKAIGVSRISDGMYTMKSNAFKVAMPFFSQIREQISGPEIS